MNKLKKELQETLGFPIVKERISDREIFFYDAHRQLKKLPYLTIALAFLIIFPLLNIISSWFPPHLINPLSTCLVLVCHLLANNNGFLTVKEYLQLLKGTTALSMAVVLVGIAVYDYNLALSYSLPTIMIWSLRYQVVQKVMDKPSLEDFKTILLNGPNLKAFERKLNAIDREYQENMKEALDKLSQKTKKEVESV